MSRLTEREQVVCDRITRGLRNREIAAELHISHRTVEVHRRRIFEKYGVQTAAALTRLVVTAELKEPSHD